MTEEITIEVSDLYEQMYKDVVRSVGEQETHQQFESLIHQLYQEVEAQRKANEISINETEVTNNE
jgi:hypothetical protein